MWNQATNRRTDSRSPAALSDIPDPVLSRVTALALQAFPGECWGLLEGPDNGPGVDRATPATPRRVGRSFFLSGPDLLKLAFGKARAVFHSHVGGAAVLSGDDRAAMIQDGKPSYPVTHLVVQVASDGNSVLAARLYAWNARQNDYAVAFEPALPRPSRTSPC